MMQMTCVEKIYLQKTQNINYANLLRYKQVTSVPTFNSMPITVLDGGLKLTPQNQTIALKSSLERVNSKFTQDKLIYQFSQPLKRLIISILNILFIDKGKNLVLGCQQNTSLMKLIFEGIKVCKFLKYRTFFKVKLYKKLYNIIEG